MYWSLTLLFCFSATIIATDDKFNVLSFWQPDSTEPAHMDFVREANVWFSNKSAANGFTLTVSKDWSQMNADNLKKYQVVLFLNAIPESDVQKKSFQQYIEKGGGWMGFHGCGWVDDTKTWPWFYNTLLGTGIAENNTWEPTKVMLDVEDRNHPAMKGLPEKFMSSVSEWYAWEHHLGQNKDIDILAAVDKSSFPVGTKWNESWYSGYYPLIWTNKKYKAIYANFGHNDMDWKNNVGKSSTFASQDQNKFLLQAFHWLAGK